MDMHLRTKKFNSQRERSKLAPQAVRTTVDGWYHGWRGTKSNYWWHVKSPTDGIYQTSWQRKRRNLVADFAPLTVLTILMYGGFIKRGAFTGGST
jgi:hypothetical protein